MEAVLGILPEGVGAEQLAPGDLRENPTFLRFLSRVIYEDIGEVQHLRLEAAVQDTGHLYLLDGRTPDPAGRVVPEDIIGNVRAEAGVVVADSFEHNPQHRLLTTRRFFRLPPELETALDGKVRTCTDYLLWPDDGRPL